MLKRHGSRVTDHCSRLLVGSVARRRLGVAATVNAADLKLGLSADVTTLDPHFLAAQPNLTIARHVFESLTEVDEKTRLIPGLAESWRALDATTWEFKLRRGVKFHDGSRAHRRGRRLLPRPPAHDQGQPRRILQLRARDRGEEDPRQPYAAHHHCGAVWRAAAGHQLDPDRVEEGRRESRRRGFRQRARDGRDRSLPFRPLCARRERGARPQRRVLGIPARVGPRAVEDAPERSRAHGGAALGRDRRHRAHTQRGLREAAREPGPAARANRVVAHALSAPRPVPGSIPRPSRRSPASRSRRIPSPMRACAGRSRKRSTAPPSPSA